MSVAGKVALVTGASRGIGRATAIKLAEAGAKVAVNYTANEAAAEEVVKVIRDAGGEAFSVQADVSSAQDVVGMIAKIKEMLGDVDILVNNAGVTADGLLLRMKESDWDKVVNTSLKGTYLCSKAVLKSMMRSRWGRIINLTSVVALTGNAGQANYSAAKAGIIGFTKSMAKEVASRNILVNCVAPGYIETDMTAELGDEAAGELKNQIPLGRAGSPDDVAGVVIFLASSAAGYITGQVVPVDGGMV
ncbi:3-oxoacyl-[acyl-carrier-protein] reductase [Metallumcola ferriviriculae]|uniref:3-oxoacyl-[acyl-carrier-protein] reductase n=1 Tax=Metallumcola ferriviriculae TaxID=3039180 RepID=A0AAU0UPP1_9FIRM|nr:3-oxoacyl-[acyl-carrier-protein] reductase [Desulfitibacteraceae bacterium MK1]